MKLEGKQVSHKSGSETKGQILDSKLKEDYVDQFLYQTNDKAAKVASVEPDNSDAGLRSFVEPLPTEGITTGEEHEMPEMMAFYEEDESSNIVKDICVDEGVPLHGKFLFDTSTMDEYLSTFLPPGKVIKDEVVVKEPVVEVISDPGLLKTVKDKGSEDVEEILSSQIMEVEDEKLADSSNAALKRNRSLGDLLALPQSSADSSLINQTSSSSHQEAPRRPDDNPDLAAASTSHEEHESDSKGASSSTGTIPSSSNEHSCNKVPATPAAKKVQEIEEAAERHSLDSMSDDLTNEVAGRLSFDSRLSSAAAALTTADPEDSTASKDIKLPTPNHVDPLHIAEPTSNRFRYDLGDSSFSVVASEPVPFSGSISMRSDSSATSTRSFAFPVLQSEWNSSPVRMAKADRRRLRNHRRWRNGILCCKF